MPKARLLGTDRLTDMGFQGFGLFGDNLSGGYQKMYFPQFKNAGETYGSGIDSFIILEERPDIRVKVEATLTDLFGRKISIEWDSGNLVPKATSSVSGEKYRLDREECHGIRELLVLLTNLYNDEHKYLIIDEPELNLHPQYQAFFMQEVRKVAGKPEAGKNRKVIFLITHSPFIIDVRNSDDLASVISFSSNHDVPVSISDASKRLVSLIPRLNVHHKQLFFSDNPIFVEGILDAQMIEAIQERRNFSITSAGSCLIDVGGCEEVTKYVEFCRSLKKSAYFLYDLDSLFIGNLRQCIQADGTVSDFLAQLGLGSKFGQYCGQLDQRLSEAVQKIRESSDASPEIVGLKTYIEGLATGDGKLVDRNLAKARVALLIDLRERRDMISNIIGATLAADIDGRLNQVIELLRTKNVFVLSGGALEHHLPLYVGDRYHLADASKVAAVSAEVAELSLGAHDGELEARYGELFENIARLPAKAPVDTDSVLIGYLADYVHDVQGRIISNPDWGAEQLNAFFAASSSGIAKLFQVSDFKKTGEKQFVATVTVQGADGGSVRNFVYGRAVKHFVLRPRGVEAVREENGELGFCHRPFFGW
uniref:ATP-dependent nuclease n=1 Tax=Rhizobium terrae TaxID=2171756 RepID=UPI0013C348B8